MHGERGFDVGGFAASFESQVGEVGNGFVLVHVSHFPKPPGAEVTAKHSCLDENGAVFKSVLFQQVEHSGAGNVVVGL